MGYGLFASFRGTIFARERRGMFIAWRRATESYGADLNSCHKSRGEDKKRGLVLTFMGAFCSGTRLYSPLGGHKQNFGGVQALKCTSVAPGRACYLLLGHNSRLGAHFALGGHIFCLGEQAMILGVYSPEMPPGGAEFVINRLPILNK